MTAVASKEVASILDPNASKRRPMGLWANGMLMTPEEFDAEEDWNPNYRYELINGVLIVSPPAEEGERGPNDELGYLLRDYQYRNSEGSRIDDTLSEQTVATAAGRRRMDRAIWIGFGRNIQPNKDIPTIAVEYVANRSRDRHRDFVEKRAEYEAIGVVEYWIIDRFRRTLSVIRKGDVQVFSEKDTYRTDLLPGFELPLQRLLAISDKYK
jgi:Uma2 family endonuclease